MNLGALLAANSTAVVMVLALGWAILRFEGDRYAARHPSSPLVQDVEKAVKDARLVASVLGLDPEKEATWVAGFLSARGIHVGTNQILTAAAQVGAQAAKDTAALGKG